MLLSQFRCVLSRALVKKPMAALLCAFSLSLVPGSGFADEGHGGGHGYGHGNGNGNGNGYDNGNGSKSNGYGSGITNGMGGGYGSSKPDDAPEKSSEGFECIQEGGFRLRSTNLPASCEEWWPDCVKKAVKWPQKFPQRCESPLFRVVKVPTANSDPFISSKSYSKYDKNYDSELAQSNSTEPSSRPQQGGTSILVLGTQKDAPSRSKGGGIDKDSSAATVADVADEASSPDARTTETSLQKSAGAKDSLALQSARVKKGDSTATTQREAEAATAQGSADSPAANGSLASNDPASRDALGTPSQKASFAGRIGRERVRAGADSPQSLPENTAVTKNHDAYTDPWMAYVTASSREELVGRLVKNSDLREELQRRLDELNDGPGASDTARREKRDYYRKALLEAQTRLRRGTLNALAPMDAREAFSMNVDDTDREIKRLLASMDDHAADMSDKDDGLHYPLFPRVHRAIWRQLSNGKIQLKPNGR